jgi:hypothetical protein
LVLDMGLVGMDIHSMVVVVVEALQELKIDHY